jgi:hypothetical protein
MPMLLTVKGDTHYVVLVPWSKKGLFGDTDLGTFELIR